jgi:hypothetical protein
LKLSTITFAITMTQPAHIIATLANANRGPLSASGSSSAKHSPAGTAMNMARAVPNRRPSGRATSAPRTPPTPRLAMTRPVAADDSPTVRTRKTTRSASTPVSARLPSDENAVIARR